MTPADVLSLLKEKEVKFVDLRFTDTRGKEQHLTIPSIPSTTASSKTARCSTARRLPVGRASRSPT